MSARNYTLQRAQGAHALESMPTWQTPAQGAPSLSTYSAPADGLARFDRSDTVDDEGRDGYGGPRSGAAIVKDFAKMLPRLSRHSERTDIEAISVF